MTPLLPSKRQLFVTSGAFLLLGLAFAGLGEEETWMIACDIEGGQSFHSYTPPDRLYGVSQIALDVFRWPLGGLAIGLALSLNAPEWLHVAIVLPALLVNTLLWALVACIGLNAAWGLLRPRAA